jgi:3',5'-cyclic AMP phosphodiesterase CpdA
MGIPWAFVWGNHDTSEDHHKCHPIISSAANSLYRGTLYDGNYRIDISSPGESKPFWTFIIVNDGLPESGFQKDQIKWFREETARIKEKYPAPPPAFAFFHVPLTQFNTIWAKGIAKGVKFEPVQFEKGIPEGFDAIKDSGMVKAVFCGHDHYNNYSGELDGIELQYLRSTGYAGYGGDKVKKGGTIITIDTSKPEKQYDSLVVFADGSTLSLTEPLK